RSARFFFRIDLVAQTGSGHGTAHVLVFWQYLGRHGIARVATAVVARVVVFGVRVATLDHKAVYYTVKGSAVVIAFAGQFQEIFFMQRRVVKKDKFYLTMRRRNRDELVFTFRGFLGK